MQGASRGIGRTTALALAETGAHVLAAPPRKPNLWSRVSSPREVARALKTQDFCFLCGLYSEDYTPVRHDVPFCPKSRSCGTSRRVV